MSSAGNDLRRIRDRLGLTMRDVENASMLIAQRHDSDEYLVPPSRLSDIETKGVVPSVYRFYSLAAIYHKSVGSLLELYGINLNEIGSEWALSLAPAKSHVITLDEEQRACRMPVKMDPGFDLRETSNLGRMVQEWGTVPMAMLSHMESPLYTYAYIGSEDFTMYPILPPGSFVQVDEKRRHVQERQWRSEYERPIYLVETRDGVTCCWCSLRPSALVLQPHPLSPVPVRVLKCPQDADVIGQIIGVAMRIGSAVAAELQEVGEFSEPKTSVVLPSSSSLKAAAGANLTSIATRKKLG